MIRRISAVVLGLTAILSFGSLTTPLPANAAEGRQGALLGGMAAGALVGGALAGGLRPYAPPPPVYGGPAYYEPEDEYIPAPPPRCFVERRPAYNSWGDFVGYRAVRTCD